MKFKCPNHLRGCTLEENKESVMSHLRTGCSYAPAHLTPTYYKGQEPNFFDALLAACIVNEIVVGQDPSSTATFDGGGGGESGGGGANGSWESDSSSSTESDTSSSDSSSGGSD